MTTQEDARGIGRVAGARFAPQRIRPGLADKIASVREGLEAELAEGIGFQWLAVAFGLGALIYFILPREPPLWPLLFSCAVAVAIALALFQRGGAWRGVTLVAICLAGVSAAKVRVEHLSGPHVERERYVEMTARVVDAEQRAERRPRVVLDHIVTDDLSGDERPDRIRITLAERYGLPPLGATIALRAQLMPVAGSVVPGGYDARRAAFFEGVGASGFALGGWEVVGAPPGVAADLMVSRIREAIVARILAAEPGEAGAVAAALLVGERSALSEQTNESLRISGLAHILSISGLHMMLIAGAAFFTVRALLALSQRLALTMPIRKWAAIAALLVVTIYLTLSGGGSATVRAYVMAAIMFGAILVDRPVISMRNLAVAAFVVLALEPESITEPGFQMSFAAVAALIAAWEAWGRRRVERLADDDSLPGLWVARWLGRALVAIMLTTLVAGLATAPFAAYHFERVASYSLLGNLLAAPLITVIMASGLAVLGLLPFGWEAAPLFIMARGIEALLAVSDWVAGLPAADITAPAIAPACLLLITAGMLWVCLWRLPWRFAGLVPIAFGIGLVPALSNPPDILVAPEGSAVAVRDQSGHLRVSGSRSGSYVIEQFFDEEPGPAPEGEALREGVSCDPSACVLSGAGRVLVAHVLDPAAFPEDCRRADVVVTALAAPVDCGAAVIIGAAELATRGPYAIRIRDGDGDLELAVEAERNGFPRPWQPGG